MARADGATMGYFPPDEATFLYQKGTGGADAHIDAVRNYFQAQGMFGIPRGGDCDYSTLLELDLGTVVPSVAGPKRPQDRIALPSLKDQFLNLLQKPISDGGYGKTSEDIAVRYSADIGASEHGLAGIVGGGEQHSAGAPAPLRTHAPQKATTC